MSLCMGMSYAGDIMMGMAKIGITTTVPIEVIYAAGHVPVDLNNVFVSHPDYEGLMEES